MDQIKESNFKASLKSYEKEVEAEMKERENYRRKMRSRSLEGNLCCLNRLKSFHRGLPTGLSVFLGSKSQDQETRKDLDVN